VKYYPISGAIAVGQFVQAGLPCFAFATSSLNSIRRRMASEPVGKRFEQRKSSIASSSDLDIDVITCSWYGLIVRIRMIPDIRCVNG